ncbi:ChaN family lipoprotein [Marinobacter salinisoli]|uniref:ChaN family lipoprotein n=1 Tax=Marinobacter salinisoli TaxID=2769486 RepID=A0ABX7MVQ7_9GAMM|nr:ChaN family lipoprotein [Marinobacter salinisoli]QSP95186.1 ChaN family lipoprotein [Marinobacter salinisoli]
MTTSTDNALAPVTLYDAPIFHAVTGAPMSVDQLAEQLRDTDVIVVGEYHGHQGAHLLQARLQAALYQRRPAQVLTMEQFTLDHQGDVDRYLSGETGETELIEDGDAWENYRASYRPMVEFARRHDIPVMAANAPADIVRCVGRKGAGHLDTLPADVRQQLPRAPFQDTPGYREKFLQAIGQSHRTDSEALDARMHNTYLAQLLRDNTMAARILQALEQHPGHQVLHLTGTFHSEERLGTVGLLEARAPALSVAVISPVFRSDDEPALAAARQQNKGDYLYIIAPLPPEFRDSEREMKAMQARFGRSAGTDCS